MGRILLSFVMFCFLWERSDASAIKKALLFNDDNAQKLDALNDAGQAMDRDDSKRLLNFDKRIAYSMNVCCFYGNILDFYISDILNTEEKLPYVTAVREILDRFSRELRTKGCSSLQGNDQELIMRFKEEFWKMGKQGLFKAVGELGSLVHDLDLFC